MKLQLESRAWELGDRLKADPSGSEVFEAMADDGSPAVVKFVKKLPGADREVLIGEAVTAARLPNVVPILDTGEHGEYLVLVMPRAEKSLAQHLAKLDGKVMDADELLSVLTDVAVALVAIEKAGIVHRDLKPANVLLLHDTWCLADFGIARYTEATTATHTRMRAKTREYAAPEQWREERATSTTDVYAFGVMASEMATGVRPFPGPATEDYREQHLTAPPPHLTRGPHRLRAIVQQCLSKEAAARPKPGNLLVRLNAVLEEPRSGAVARLAEQSSRVVQKANEAAVEAELMRQAGDARSRLATDGIRAFSAFSEPLLEHIKNDAPAAEIEYRRGNWAMLFVARLGGGQLGVVAPDQSREWGGPFDVVADATITVNLKRDHEGWNGRSHSLWFCDAFEQGRYAWYEFAFMDAPSSGNSRRPPREPYALEPESALVVFSNENASGRLARPVVELDVDDPAKFVDRWLGWFADAAGGTVARPITMPEQPDDARWRHG
ncbi:serine/threonine-protein kinase [Promicromonospora sp. NPDC060271]|uniref:serine/threonine-protein kinase n=1 Tax=Promicromonospora sp. NPDC060271 TaxID=3347089 RepID=UPI003658B1F2